MLPNENWKIRSKVRLLCAGIAFRESTPVAWNGIGLISNDLLGQNSNLRKTNSNTLNELMSNSKTIVFTVGMVTRMKRKKRYENISAWCGLCCKRNKTLHNICIFRIWNLWLDLENQQIIIQWLQKFCVFCLPPTTNPPSLQVNQFLVLVTWSVQRNIWVLRKK